MSSSESPDHTLGRIINERRAKAESLRSHGRNPYRNDFQPSHRCAEVRARYLSSKPDPDDASARKPGITPVDGETLRLAGRVVARRGFGKTVFAPIRDDSGDMQLFINVDHLDKGDFEHAVSQLDAGDIVGAEGVIFWTKRGEMSLLCKRLHIVTKSLRPLPDKWKGLRDVELRYRQRHLDLAVSPEVRDVFRKRSRIVSCMRRYFDERNYLEVETPMMHPIVGGAAARPFITHHNTLDMQLFMRIAPELYLKRLLVGGFERVYEINRCFRNEGLDRSHNPEFTTVEFYQAYATYEDLMDLTEDMIRRIAQEVNGCLTTTWDGVDLDLAPSWRRLTVRQAVEAAGQSVAVFDDLAQAVSVALSLKIAPSAVANSLIQPLAKEAVDGLAREFADGSLPELSRAIADTSKRNTLLDAITERYSDDLEVRVRAGHLGYMIFEEVAEDALIQPTFLTEFPLAVSPLARKNENDPAFCDRFELFVCGKELANAFSELNDPDDQRARFVAQMRARAVGADETMDYDEDYCRALELGMPPAAGEGIGIDRLTMMLTGQPSIRDVILFPLMRPE